MNSDFFNIVKNNLEIENNSNLLSAKIENIDGLGLLSIAFNNHIDLELVQSRNGQFLINNKLLDIYI